MGLRSQNAIAALILLAAVMAGCRSEGPAPASAAAPARGPGSRAGGVSASPVDAARRIHQGHSRRDYAAIARLIIEKRRGPTILFLRAVDEVIDRNDALRRAAARRFGGPLSDAWSIAPMRNNLGIFSADVRFISQRFKGGEAVVTLQEGENVPLIRARFVETEAGWQLDPDPAPIHLIDELGALSNTLAEVTQSLQRGGDFDSYVEAFLYQVLPQMRRIMTAEEEGGPQLSSADPRP